MSIWGKLIGGVAGYAIGGPLGGIMAQWQAITSTS